VRVEVFDRFLAIEYYKSSTAKRGELMFKALRLRLTAARVADVR
jgi:hypothetical protein